MFRVPILAAKSEYWANIIGLYFKISLVPLGHYFKLGGPEVLGTVIIVLIGTYSCSSYLPPPIT